jgi:hypothetical protein
MSKVMAMSIAALRFTLFEPSSSFWTTFFSSVSFQSSTLSDAAWENPPNGSEQRVYSVEIPLPQVLGDTLYAKSFITEKYLLKQPGRRFVVESVIRISGIPGGSCQIHARYCLTARGKTRSHLLVSYEAVPPKSSFFKESFRQSLNAYFSSFFENLVKHLQNQHSLQVDWSDEGLLKRRLSLWRNSPSSKRAQSSFMQVYFDWSAFWRSLLWLSPFVVVFVAVICMRSATKPPSQSLDGNLRIERISSIQDQFRGFLAREQIATKSLGSQVIQIVDQLSKRINQMEPPKLYEEER